tara:strand:+ start:1156 stop:1551 length:396 start_codon:yes stop_codon:yes gene_type:complete
MTLDTIHTSDTLASIFAYLFILWFVGLFLYGYFTGKVVGDLPSWMQELREGRLNIGYIEESPKENVVVHAVIEAKPKPLDAKDKSFREECIGALCNLGVKKAQSKKAVEEFFNNNPDVKTMDEFIEKVFEK